MSADSTSRLDASRSDASLSDELGALAAALSRELARSRRRGQRRTPECAIADGPTAAPPSAAGRSSDAQALRGTATVAARARAAGDWDELAAAVAGCEECGLCRTRTQTVFADGRGPARVMFVGEAPGENEDLQGIPFVGRAGALLSDIIEKGMGLKRQDVVIANVLKCRPPENRDPTNEEKATCTPWLERQIELLGPEILVALGRHAAGHLLKSDAPMSKLRGRVHRVGGRKIVATYHPAFLLRSPHMKKECWQDIQLVMAELGLPNPSGRRSAGTT